MNKLKIIKTTEIEGVLYDGTNIDEVRKLIPKNSKTEIISRDDLLKILNVPEDKRTDEYYSIRSQMPDDSEDIDYVTIIRSDKHLHRNNWSTSITKDIFYYWDYGNGLRGIQLADTDDTKYEVECV